MGEFGENSGNSPSRAVFGEFRLDLHTGELRAGNRELHLTPRAAAVLTYLAKRAPQVVTKAELLAHVWGGKSIGDEAITSCIRELRRVLGDDSRKPRYVETRHRRGYRLIAAAKEGSVPPSFNSSPHKPSIAVLPFRDLDGRPHQDRLVRGLAADITTALSYCTDIAIIATDAVLADGTERSTAHDVVRQFGVRYLLTGSAQRDRGRLRISARLVDATSGEQIWAERYDHAPRDLLLLQDDISSRIVATIAPRIIRAEERRVKQLPGDSLRAYELALLSQAISCQGDGADDAVVEQRHREGIRLAQRAITLDPDCAIAHAALALAYICLPDHYYFQPECTDLFDKAVTAAEKLRRLDSTSYVAYYIAGKICQRRQQAQEALANLRRAHELNPNSCDVLRALAWAEHNLGLGVEAREHCALALRLGPNDPRRYQLYWGLAWAEFVSAKPVEGAKWARKAIEEAPAFFPTYSILAACLAEAGDLETARKAVRHLLQHRRSFIVSRLEGKNFVAKKEVDDRYTAALRLAAGQLDGLDQGAARSTLAN